MLQCFSYRLFEGILRLILFYFFVQFAQEYAALERECGRLKKKVESKANRVRSLEAALNELKTEAQKEKQA